MSVMPDLTMIIAVAGAAFCAIALFILLFTRRAGAYSRHIDERRMRRAKFQDEWSQILRAADDFARASNDRGRQR